METKKITVMPYDVKWEEDYKTLREVILRSLGNLAIRIEHIGSTSVRGMSAKPIIDMDVVINDRKDFNDVILSLANAGYVYEGDLGIADREAFAYKGEAELPEHHLYVCPEDSPELRKHTAFRDYLRTNPDAAREYSRIKEKGADLYPDDIEKYIQYKSSYIQKVYAELELS